MNSSYICHANYVIVRFHGNCVLVLTSGSDRRFSPDLPTMSESLEPVVPGAEPEPHAELSNREPAMTDAGDEQLPSASPSPSLHQHKSVLQPAVTDDVVLVPYDDSLAALKATQQGRQCGLVSEAMGLGTKTTESRVRIRFSLQGGPK